MLDVDKIQFDLREAFLKVLERHGLEPTFCSVAPYGKPKSPPLVDAQLEDGVATRVISDYAISIDAMVWRVEAAFFGQLKE